MQHIYVNGDLKRMQLRKLSLKNVYIKKGIESNSAVFQVYLNSNIFF